MPLVAIQAVFVTFRFWTGSPYPVAIDPFRIVINLAYYLAVGIFALPDNYGYATSLPLWREQPLLPIVAVVMTVCALGIAGWLFVAARQKTPERPQQALWFAAWWSLIALYPVILTATGRTAFMSSIGIAWMLAIGWAAIWQVADRQRTWCAVALILLVGAHAGVASYRAYWWRQAGNEMERTIARIDASLADIPPGAAVCVVGLPDHLHHAYVFRNAFPALNQVRFPDHVVHAFLDNESDAALQDERCAHSIIVGAQRCCAPRRPSRRSAAALPAARPGAALLRSPPPVQAQRRCAPRRPSRRSGAALPAARPGAALLRSPPLVQAQRCCAPRRPSRRSAAALPAARPGAALLRSPPPVQAQRCCAPRRPSRRSAAALPAARPGAALLRSPPPVQAQRCCAPRRPSRRSAAALPAARPGAALLRSPPPVQAQRCCAPRRPSRRSAAALPAARPGAAALRPPTAPCAAGCRAAAASSRRC
jgi:hypothetical protein